MAKVFEGTDAWTEGFVSRGFKGEGEGGRAERAGEGKGVEGKVVGGCVGVGKGRERGGYLSARRSESRSRPP